MTERQTPTVELVTYRLKPGADAAAHARAAAALEAGLRARPGFLQRTLSEAEDGTWCDHILWATPEAARATAAEAAEIPGFAAFVADIDGHSVAMRHATQRLHLARRA